MSANSKPIDSAALKSARNSLGWSYKTAAERIGVSASTIGRWESGEPMAIGKIDAVAKAYGIRPQEFVLDEIREPAVGEGEPPPYRAVEDELARLRDENRRLLELAGRQALQIDRLSQELRRAK